MFDKYNTWQRRIGLEVRVRTTGLLTESSFVIFRFSLPFKNEGMDIPSNSLSLFFIPFIDDCYVFGSSSSSSSSPRFPCLTVRPFFLFYFYSQTFPIQSLLTLHSLLLFLIKLPLWPPGNHPSIHLKTRSLIFHGLYQSHSCNQVILFLNSKSSFTAKDSCFH